MKKTTILLLMCIGILSFVSCNEEDDLYQEELTTLKAYLDENDIESNSKNLYKIPLKTGIGEICENGDNITVTYTGWYISSATKIIEFDSNVDGDAFTFTLGSNQVISGWESLVPGMREGDMARLIMSSAKAYGGQQIGLIPAYSSLIFDVTIENVQKN